MNGVEGSGDERHEQTLSEQLIREFDGHDERETPAR